MKKLITALVAASIGFGSAAPSFAADFHREGPVATATQYQSDHRDTSKSQKQAQRAEHRFTKGERFDRKRASRYSELNASRYARLNTPPRGYHWVRSGDDALLVGIGSNIVTSIVRNMF